MLHFLQKLIKSTLNRFFPETFTIDKRKLFLFERAGGYSFSFVRGTVASEWK